MVAGSGSSTGLKSELRMCSVFELHDCSFKKQTIEGQKTQSLLLLQPYYCFYIQLKVAKVRPKQAQLVCAAHGTREPWGSKTQALLPLQQCYCFDAQLKVTKLPSNLIVNAVTKQNINQSRCYYTFSTKKRNCNLIGESLQYI